MANTQEPTDPKTEDSGAGQAGAGSADSTGTPHATQGGSRGAANATGRHSKEADHSPGSPAELHKTKGTDKPA
jgi:hypothetical protein